MSTKFKVGDRVRAYGPVTKYVDDEMRWTLVEVPLVVTNLSDNGLKLKKETTAFAPEDNIYYAHTKQCRRLKPKEEKRRLWIETLGPLSALSGRLEQPVHLTKPAKWIKYCVEFREVTPKK